MSIIKVVCAWCGKDMGEKDGQGVEGISHGMCDKCYTNIVKGEVSASCQAWSPLSTQRTDDQDGGKEDNTTKNRTQ